MTTTNKKAKKKQQKNPSDIKRFFYKNKRVGFSANSISGALSIGKPRLRNMLNQLVTTDYLVKTKTSFGVIYFYNKKNKEGGK